MKQMNKDLLDEITDIEVLRDGYRSLNKLIMMKESKLDQQQQEIERLNNIIKEVREYIEKNIVDYITNYDDLRENILAILDKVDKENI